MVFMVSFANELQMAYLIVLAMSFRAAYLMMIAFLAWTIKAAYLKVSMTSLARTF